MYTVYVYIYAVYMYIDSSSFHMLPLDFPKAKPGAVHEVQPSAGHATGPEGGAGYHGARGRIGARQEMVRGGYGLYGLHGI